MIKYFRDIFTASSAILGGMFITLNHLIRAKVVLLHYNILKKDGLDQKEILVLIMKIIMLLDLDFMLT